MVALNQEKSDLIKVRDSGIPAANVRIGPKRMVLSRIVSGFPPINMKHTDIEDTFEGLPGTE